MRYYSLKVIELRAETADAVTIIFKQPALKKIIYAAGQYLTLIFRINGRRYIRPYSFSSAPQVDPNLEITVKRVPGGIVSNHIIDKLQVNDIVEVMEPLGSFVLNPKLRDKDIHIVLWGAGSGITPLMSIAKYALATKFCKHVTLVYGNRDTENTIFHQQIQRLKQQNDQFSAWHFYSKGVIDFDNPYLVQGRIAPAKVLEVMQQQGNVNETVHYICGPTGLKESVREELNKLNVPECNILTEDFEVVRNPLDFEGIISRNVLITKGNIQTKVEVVKGKSILEAGLDALLELNYSCQTGNCVVCKGIIKSGEIKMIGVEKLPETLGADECLLCSSFPLTDDTEIIVD